MFATVPKETTDCGELRLWRIRNSINSDSIVLPIKCQKNVRVVEGTKKEQTQKFSSDLITFPNLKILGSTRFAGTYILGVLTHTTA